MAADVALLRLQGGKANALTPSLLDDLERQVAGFLAGPAAAAVVIGYERYFSAGLPVPELIDLDVVVAGEGYDLVDEHAVGLGGGVLGFDGDDQAGGAGLFAVAASAVVDGGVHGESEAGRRVDDDGVEVLFQWRQGPFERCVPGTAEHGEAGVEQEGVECCGQDA